jgi:hypothetical protein
MPEIFAAPTFSKRPNYAQKIEKSQDEGTKDEGEEREMS